eukprot:Blabericola_migrator_1__12966@NODE_85_length_14814_cov_131_925612_g76_i0_p3_GENE_NODE_85_length_14814_cov_131_925612_g76_i0NODE_85_length_14814_cov_131_925612_g76_i0_p3_ORF_typecomplete_len830_score160_87_NODE_85_length_14814_cov_131_925612_g76_i01422631
MSQNAPGGERKARRSTTSSTPIDLLVVAEDAADSTGKPNLARGLSIKLSPPEDSESDQEVADTPAFYKSTSIVSVASFESERRGSGLLDTDIPIPSQEDRLSDLGDANKSLGTALPLHRTESRLPSLEDMLNDEKLKASLYEDAKSVILDELAAALTKKEQREKFKRLSELARKASNESTFSMTRLTSKQKQAVIETAVLFVKQQLAKSVEYWRAMIDAREGGMSQADFDNKVAHPDFEFGARPWAFISLGLKLLRNLCVTAEIQGMIDAHNLADVILLRHRLLFSAVASSSEAFPTAPPSHKPYHEEVANALPRSVFTFLSNLMANNDELRLKMWPLMWPNAYWSFLLLAGERFFDNFCLLLHNHLTPLLGAHNKGEDDSITDLGAFSRSAPSVQRLKDDLELLCATEEELAIRKANNEDDTSALSQEFLNFIMALLSIVYRRHARQAKGGGHHKGRLASVQGRATQASAIAEDWFALLLLRLLSQGKGHALKLLVQCMLKRGTERTMPSTGGPDEWMSWCGVPPDVANYIKACSNYNYSLINEGPAAGEELAGLLIYSAAEYASVPDEKKALQQVTGDTPGALEEKDSVKQKTEMKLGRRWNLVRRSFLTGSIVNFMVRLFSESAIALVKAMEPIAAGREGAWAHCKELATLPTVRSGENSARNATGAALDDLRSDHLELLVRPLTKCLISLACAPELAGRWSESAAEQCWQIARALLIDTAPFLQEFIAVGGEAKDGPYIGLLNYMSPRDELILLAGLIDMNSDLQEEVDGDLLKTVLKFQVFQTLDVGCEQAAILALRVMTKDHAGNSETLEQIRNSVPARATDQ